MSPPICGRAFRVAALRSFGVGALLLIGASEVQAASADRLYIKYQDKVAFAIDPDGTVYSRGDEEHGTGNFTGLVFLHQDFPICAIREENPGVPAQFGRFVMLASGGVFAPWSPLPFQPSGSLLFSYNDIGRFEVDQFDGSISATGEYARKFGYRKDARNLTAAEKANFVAAVLWTDTQFYPGDFGVSDGTGSNGMGQVSYWDKIGQVHQRLFPAIHSNGTFLPWHREMLSRMEETMRTYDPLVSLPYWNWETNPVTAQPVIISSTLNGFTGWMGNDQGRVGYPFEALDNNGIFAGSFEESCPFDNLDAPGCNPARPPELLDRFVESGVDPITFGIVPDSQVAGLQTWEQMRSVLEHNAHDVAHHYLCDDGEILSSRAPEDPMFWLLHTNCDRVWAVWQTLGPFRSHPNFAYGNEGANPNHPLSGNIEPWSGGAGIRPWTATDNFQSPKAYKDLSVLVAPLYD
jgi:hypothetical protein